VFDDVIPTGIVAQDSINATPAVTIKLAAFLFNFNMIYLCLYYNVSCNI
jgi:hypothetical protein